MTARADLGEGEVGEGRQLVVEARWFAGHGGSVWVWNTNTEIPAHRLLHSAQFMAQALKRGRRQHSFSLSFFFLFFYTTPVTAIRPRRRKRQR
jgi:hypothetical protein